MDWRTTIPGLVGGLAMIVKSFGIDVPSSVTDGVVAICFWFLGLWATSGRK